MKYILIPTFLLCLFSSSCKREIIPAEDIELGKDYYPLTGGHFVEYAVDSIHYDDFNKRTDTSHFEYRDEIGSTFLDNENRESYIIQRFKRKDATEAWVESLTYYATETNTNLEVVEENLRFIKLVFPVKANTRWAGNRYIPASTNESILWYNGWDYRYANINETYNNGLKSYPNAVVVTEANLPEGDASDPSSYSALTFSKEVYAKKVGLIYRELTRWEYQNQGSKYKNGFTVIFRAINNN